MNSLTADSLESWVEIKSQGLGEVEMIPSNMEFTIGFGIPNPGGGSPTIVVRCMEEDELQYWTDPASMKCHVS